MLMQPEQDAFDMLYRIENTGLMDHPLSGKQLQEMMELDEQRARRCILLMSGRGFLREGTKIFGDGPEWALTYYRMSPLGMSALITLQGGDNPFKHAPSLHHSGDNISFTAGNISNSALALGRHATASYAAGIDAKSFNDALAEFREKLKALPEDERDDGEHQLELLARAAEKGPEAMQGRVKSFSRYLLGAWDDLGRAATILPLWHIASALFASGGVILPPLPAGL